MQALANSEYLISLDEFVSVYHRVEDVELVLESECVWPMPSSVHGM